jgi:hypothetical protein
MSSQGANTTVLNTGYVFNPASERDASDITRTIREKIMAVETLGFDLITPSKSEEPKWIKYSNGFRLSFLRGYHKCAGCEGNIYGFIGGSLESV